jgi:adenylosuccinate synthase
MSTKIVVGLGFGDEGKGKVVNYLASLPRRYSNLPSPVVRFSGGQQAGHTVCEGNFAHIFSNIGSGAYHQCGTVWTKYCTFDPVGLDNELRILRERWGLNPTITVDPECPVTTWMDKESQRTNYENVSHGTCGVGVGTTWEREENHYKLRAYDLQYPSVHEEKLNLISANYYPYSGSDSSAARERYMAAVESLFTNPRLFIKSCSEIPTPQDMIFEGSQGIMLDKDVGFFPHVTRSKTTTEKAFEIIGGAEALVYAVTRAYQTRHGTGPMTGFPVPELEDIKDNTNVDHPFQGELRIRSLDLNLLKYAIDSDPGIKRGKYILVVTCLDHLEERNLWPYTYDCDLKFAASSAEFLDTLRNFLSPSQILISRAEDQCNLLDNEIAV